MPALCSVTSVGMTNHRDLSSVASYLEGTTTSSHAAVRYSHMPMSGQAVGGPPHPRGPSERDLATGGLQPRQSAAASVAAAGANIWKMGATATPSGIRISVPTVPSPVELRSPEPPDAEYRTDDQEHDFEHGHHVRAPSPETPLHATPAQR